MQKFQNVLLVTDGLEEDADAFDQALSQARNNQAKLSVLVLPPSLPQSFAERQEAFDQGLLAQVKSYLAEAAKRLRTEQVRIDYQVERGNRPATLVIRDVLRNQRDLVVRQAEPVAGGQGFSAADLELLRKCPAPVWLCRPIRDSHEAMQVAVAVEPEPSRSPQRDLSLDLLRLGRRLADECNGRLIVISAWDCSYESSLRNSAFIKISEAEVKNEVERTCRDHHDALDKLLAEAAMGGDVQVEHARGAAADVVIEQVERAGVDILVMGTIARTGVAGLLIGNTAENVLRRLPCSLVALKPKGFVSPVKIDG